MQGASRCRLGPRAGLGSAAEQEGRRRRGVARRGPMQRGIATAVTRSDVGRVRREQPSRRGRRGLPPRSEPALRGRLPNVGVRAALEQDPPRPRARQPPPRCGAGSRLHGGAGPGRTCSACSAAEGRGARRRSLAARPAAPRAPAAPGPAQPSPGRARSAGPSSRCRPTAVADSTRPRWAASAAADVIDGRRAGPAGAG